MNQPDLFEQIAKITRPRIESDITARKHGGVETSVEADKRVDKTAGRMMVMDYLGSHIDGTLKEICRYFHKEKNELSGRFTELGPLGMGMIERTGEKRNGCFVWRLK
jgi:hypothetical protein